jgi:cytochrome b subunit of formate dehydrogenase
MSDVANITTTILPYPYFTDDTDMLLIIASVSMAVATLVLLLLVRRILHLYNAFLILLGEIS